MGISIVFIRSAAKSSTSIRSEKRLRPSVCSFICIPSALVSALSRPAAFTPLLRVHDADNASCEFRSVQCLQSLSRVPVRLKFHVCVQRSHGPCNPRIDVRHGRGWRTIRGEEIHSRICEGIVRQAYRLRAVEWADRCLQWVRRVKRRIQGVLS